jgi:hypothetical protein
MTTYRKSLPQLGSRLFLTDGIETTLIFHEGLDLPYFAAFHLLRDLNGGSGKDQHRTNAATNRASWLTLRGRRPACLRLRTLVSLSV